MIYDIKTDFWLGDFSNVFCCWHHDFDDKKSWDMSRIADIFILSFCKTHPSSISVYPEQLVLWRWILMLNLLIYEFEFSSNIINSKWVTDRFRWLWVLIRDLQLAWINWFLKIYHSTDRRWPIWWPRIFKLWFLVHDFCDRALSCLRFCAGFIILF